MVICTLVKIPRLGGQWWSIPDVVMILARGRRLSVVSVQAISGAGSIEYFIVFHIKMFFYTFLSIKIF